MKKQNNINFKLNGKNTIEKRDELKNYFLNTYNQFENIFELLKDDSVFYKKSEPTRHPMIFYYGHTATFFINKFILANMIENRVNKEFESIFAIGVDEMSWDDINEKHYKWPKVQDVKEYRLKVKNIVLDLINNIEFTLPITWDSPMWIILMGIEHERIHIETSLVLHRQMPLEFIKEDMNLKICDIYTEGIKNEFIEIKKQNIILGKPTSSDTYGWDNEYGIFEEDLEKFQVSKYLVSNEEYMPFVLENGYETEEYWCEDGKEFLNNTKAKHPIFWIKNNNTFKYRAINKIINMPLSWPIEVNALEAKAFLKYKSLKDNINYSLPSEAQYKAIYNYSKVTNEQNANHNLDLYSSCPVNIYNFNGIYDVIGNVWQWSRTKMFPFKGFKEHEIYDDFTVPTFDNKHALINGSSWASSGNLIDPYSRYAFREHFYQNAGFRYTICKEKENNTMEKQNIYETDNLVSQYCEFHYGSEYFGVQNFSIACANIAKNYMNNANKVLDIGCATGRLSFELAKYFNEVDAIDFSARFIQVGVNLQENGKITYKSCIEGDLSEDKNISMIRLGYDSIKNKVSFFQGDACNLKAQFNSYDMIIATNLIDRLYDPKLFLQDVSNRLNTNGILIITSPYTWLEEYTKKDKFLGGYINKDGKDIYTIDTLEDILNNEFTLVHTQDVEFVIKETKRKFQHSVSQLSVWRKK